MKRTSIQDPADPALDRDLDYLGLPVIKEDCRPLAERAAAEHWTHLHYLASLMGAECAQRQERSVARRIKNAHFPVLKTLDTYRWDWPKKINRLQIQNLLRLDFLEHRSNVIFLGLVGLGKTHLATAIGYAACQRGHSVLFANTVDAINTLSAAQATGTIKAALRRYLRPELLILDEVGYLPIDGHGADLLFQIITGRYERGSIVLTTNKAFKQWASIFNGDSVLASAALDRLLHHSETVLIEGLSYRMKDRVET
jgi:DNA replication protein DnaC